jgi:hypothetical protein
MSYKSPPSVPILSKINPTYNLTFYFFNISSDTLIILSSSCVFKIISLPQGSFPEIWMHLSSPLFVLHDSSSHIVKLKTSLLHKFRLEN